MAIWNDWPGAVEWPGVVPLITWIGQDNVSYMLLTFAITPLASVFIRVTWLRILMTTIPLTCWILILFQGLRYTGFYAPAVWTALVCVLSLVHAEIRRARDWEANRG